MGKPRKVKNKQVSQKRFERLQKRADKKPNDRLMRGVSATGTYDNSITKVSKKGNLKKTYTPKSKDRNFTTTDSPGDLAGTIRSMPNSNLKRLDRNLRKQIKTTPIHGNKHSQVISKRTTMQSKYGGTLLPEVTITAPGVRTAVPKNRSDQ